MKMIFLIFLIGIALFLQSRGTENAFRRLICDHQLDKRVVEPEESFLLTIWVENTSKRIVPFVKAAECLDSRIAFADTKDNQLSDFRGMRQVSFTAWLLPNQRVQQKADLRISQRGRYVIHGLSLSCGDFLGLWEEQISCGRFLEIIAAPKPFRTMELEERLGGFLGDSSAKRFLFEDPVLTLGWGEYTGREPMKMISWTQSAKRNRLLVKKPDYTMEPEVSVILNVESDIGICPEIMECCFSLVRSVCECLEKQNCKYSFVSNSRLSGMMQEHFFSTSGLGRGHFYGVLEQLGRATYEAEMSLDQMLHMELHRQTFSGKILITPGGSEVNYPCIERLRESAGGNLLLLNGREEWECC